METKQSPDSYKDPYPDITFKLAQFSQSIFTKKYNLTDYRGLNLYIEQLMKNNTSVEQKNDLKMKKNKLEIISQISFTEPQNRTPADREMLNSIRKDFT